MLIIAKKQIEGEYHIYCWYQWYFPKYQRASHWHIITYWFVLTRAPPPPWICSLICRDKQDEMQKRRNQISSKPQGQSIPSLQYATLHNNVVFFWLRWEQACSGSHVYSNQHHFNIVFELFNISSKDVEKQLFICVEFLECVIFKVNFCIFLVYWYQKVSSIIVWMTIWISLT